MAFAQVPRLWRCEALRGAFSFAQACSGGGLHFSAAQSGHCESASREECNTQFRIARLMVTQTKDLAMDSTGMSTYDRSSDTHHLTTMTRIVGVCTAIVVCGVGVDVAYHRHVMGLYVTAASGVIFFLEVTWAITLFVHLCVRNEDSLCSHCWLGVLATTRGWRRALFYLPLSCILAWRPNRLWLSYVAAGLLAVLSLLHIASSALGRRGPCQSGGGTDSVGESLLNSRQDNYDRFEEVLVTEVLDDGVSAPGRCPGDSDGEI
ncbi:uncharacterized protein LOC105180572 isoform X2 [Harpegnathos saltator]|uniref:uncharacterized protein LOC105180572 isoform X2 n=1 Tax=Harpegnathos saltator TaxID=610380 RepID=UPI000DBED2E0|nr:uncharacterized protein LOC105180572 isoform X2 [Harpegnathos saltator]